MVFVSLGIQRRIYFCKPDELYSSHKISISVLRCADLPDRAACFLTLTASEIRTIDLGQKLLYSPGQWQDSSHLLICFSGLHEDASAFWPWKFPDGGLSAILDCDMIWSVITCNANPAPIIARPCLWLLANQVTSPRQVSSLCFPSWCRSSLWCLHPI